MSHYEVSGLVGGLISILFGIAVIVRPRLIAYLVGGYFIIIGVLAVVASMTAK